MKKLLIATALIAASGAAMAEGAYIGGNIGSSHSNLDCTGTTSCSNNGTGVKGFVGYSFNEMFSVEGTYYDLGKASASVSGIDLDLKTTGFGVRGLVSVPFNKDFSGFAALGINRMKSNGTVNSAGFSGSTSSTSTKPSFALGVDYALSPVLKLRGEVETIRVDAPASSGNYDVRMVSVGLKYQF